MQNLYFPQEDDIKRWVKEAIHEELKVLRDEISRGNLPINEQLLTRSEIAEYLRISLVTLSNYVNRGLPRHRRRGRVLFLKSEVLDWLKQTRP